MSRVAAVLVAMTLAAPGCTVPGLEEQTLRRFFEASRARDNTLLAKVATVGLNPVTEGTVRDFEVIAIADAQTGKNIITKSVTVKAQLRTPSEETVSRVFVFTLQRAGDKPEGATTGGAWTITALR